jgi:hypothetical protein
MISNPKANTNYPTKTELVDIRARDKRCVYCGKEFNTSKETDRPTIEHLNHKEDWDSVGEYRRVGKPVSEIIAICCMACNRDRRASLLSRWFETDYCKNKNINYQTVSQVVKSYINKYEISSFEL